MSLRTTVFLALGASLAISVGSAHGKIADGHPITSLAIGADGVWAWINTYELVRVDPQTLRIESRVDTSPALVKELAIGEGGVWAVGDCGRLGCGYGTLLGFDPSTGERRRPLTKLGMNPRGVAAGYGSVWVLGARRVVPVGPRSRRVDGRSIWLGRKARDVALGRGRIWVTLGSQPGLEPPRSCLLVGIDPTRRSVIRRRPVPCDTRAKDAAGAPHEWVVRVRGGPSSTPSPARGYVEGKAVLSRVTPNRCSRRYVALGRASSWLPRVTERPDAVWVANTPTGTITRVDRASSRITGRVRPP